MRSKHTALGTCGGQAGVHQHLPLSSSVGEGASDHQVLQVLGEARRLGLGAELRYHRAQQPVLQAALHRQRQLRPHVSAISARLGPPAPTRGVCLCVHRQAPRLPGDRGLTVVVLHSRRSRTLKAPLVVF